MYYVLQYVLKSGHAPCLSLIRLKTSYKYNLQVRKLKKGIRGYTLVDHTQL